MKIEKTSIKKKFNIKKIFKNRKKKYIYIYIKEYIYIYIYKYIFWYLNI